MEVVAEAASDTLKSASIGSSERREAVCFYLNKIEHIGGKAIREGLRKVI
ncbi:hypothetical protein AAJ76_1190003782 [Vairimorpha ceranae]|uniref:Uncharacterized protein n=1 Tax=Vairimorpha ceranae TaxID=40302 RepID=A0A0F9W8R0_9MICR|nr:hypothetical protein AAJ76_1190003782 [Vairimorpha ceranae]KKO74096.1 hypothetical protein AAJ76_1190003782 [Vairimorpha ceranae]